MGQAPRNIVSRGVQASRRLQRRMSDFLVTYQPGRAQQAARTELLNLVTFIDELISDQLSAIYTDGVFKDIEARWRGLAYLVQRQNLFPENDGDKTTRIKILSINKRELHRDIGYGCEFYDTRLFKLINDQEYGSAGGEPFGMIVVDEAFNLRSNISPYHKFDLEMVSQMGRIAEASFCPFVITPHPNFFGADSFDEISITNRIELSDSDPQLQRWMKLRKQEYSKFLVMVMPSILLRRPYCEYQVARDHSIYFDQDEDPKAFLWGNPCYHFALIVLRIFHNNGWFAGLSDYSWRDKGAHLTGMISSRPSFDESQFSQLYHWKIDHHLEAEGPACLGFLPTNPQVVQLRKYGFIVIQPLKNSNDVFFTNPISIYDSSSQDCAGSTEVFEQHHLGTILPYILCMSRISHYIKKILRNIIGKFSTRAQIQTFLQRWLNTYINQTPVYIDGQMTKFPLKAGKIQVDEAPHQIGRYLCKVWIRPHLILEKISTSLYFVTDFEEPGS